MAPAERKVMLDDRNSAWVPQIEKMLAEKKVFFITVGASRHPDVDHHDFRWDRFATEDFLVSPHPYAGAGQMR